MSSLSVVKVTWEYGEQYGHVLFPHTIADVQIKIEELNQWGRQANHPFFVFLLFTDPTLALAFSVGHEYSGMEFTFDINEAGESQQGPVYLHNRQGKSDEYIPSFYGASYTDVPATRMLPYAQVVQAVYYFIEHRVFPPYIHFEDDEANQRFVAL